MRFSSAGSLLMGLKQQTDFLITHPKPPGAGEKRTFGGFRLRLHPWGSFQCKWRRGFGAISMSTPRRTLAKAQDCTLRRKRRPAPPALPCYPQHASFARGME